MSWIPKDWEPIRTGGWAEPARLRHKTCGYETRNAYDLLMNAPLHGKRDAQLVVRNHECAQSQECVQPAAA